MNNFQESDVVFVADMFLEDYGGGAERTTEALFEVSPYKTFKLNANGSKLLELITNSINFNKKTTWSIKATISIKSYLVTSDYNFKVISVDHL